MRTTAVVAVVAMAFLAVGGALAAPAPAGNPVDRLMEVLALDEVATLDFQARTMDEARELLATTAETAYRKVADIWPDREMAFPYLEQVVRGMGETSLREEEHTVIGDRKIVIADAGAAREAGEAIALVARIIHRLELRYGKVPVRETARAILRQVLIDQGTGQPIVTQVLWQLKELAAKDVTKIHDRLS